VRSSLRQTPSSSHHRSPPWQDVRQAACAGPSGKLPAGLRPSAGDVRCYPLTPASPAQLWPPCPAKSEGLSPRFADPHAAEKRHHRCLACCRREARTCQGCACQAAGAIHQQSSPPPFSSAPAAVTQPCCHALKQWPSSIACFRGPTRAAHQHGGPWVPGGSQHPACAGPVRAGDGWHTRAENKEEGSGRRETTLQK